MEREEEEEEGGKIGNGNSLKHFKGHIYLLIDFFFKLIVNLA